MDLLEQIFNRRTYILVCVWKMNDNLLGLEQVNDDRIVIFGVNKPFVYRQ